MNPSNANIKTFRDLDVYQLGFGLQHSLFVLSRRWPREEAYSLTDQARRSSRSIGANLAEAWGKRRYPAHFLSKLTDADGELQETLHWLSSATDCGYIDAAELPELEHGYARVGKMLGSMIAHHEKFCVH